MFQNCEVLSLAGPPWTEAFPMTQSLRSAFAPLYRAAREAATELDPDDVDWSPLVGVSRQQLQILRALLVEYTVALGLRIPRVLHQRRGMQWKPTDLEFFQDRADTTDYVLDTALDRRNRHR